MAFWAAKLESMSAGEVPDPPIMFVVGPMTDLIGLGSTIWYILAMTGTSKVIAVPELSDCALPTGITDGFEIAVSPCETASVPG